MYGNHRKGSGSDRIHSGRFEEGRMEDRRDGAQRKRSRDILEEIISVEDAMDQLESATELSNRRFREVLRHRIFIRGPITEGICTRGPEPEKIFTRILRPRVIFTKTQLLRK